MSDCLGHVVIGTDGLVPAHVPILGVDIWEHVSVGYTMDILQCLFTVLFTGLLPPGEFNERELSSI